MPGVNLPGFDDFVQNRSLFVFSSTLLIVGVFAFAGLSSTVDHSQDRELAEELATEAIAAKASASADLHDHLIRSSSTSSFDSTTDTAVIQPELDIDTVGIPVASAVRTLEAQSDAVSDRDLDSLIEETDQQITRGDQLIKQAGITPPQPHAESTKHRQTIDALQARLSALR